MTTSHTGSKINVTIRFPDHGFLFGFNSCFVSVAFRSRVSMQESFRWSIMADYGARPPGAYKTERTSLFNSATADSYGISVQYTFVV